MTIQVQKVQIEETGVALGLSALARVIELVLSGLPTDEAFWASRAVGHSARASELKRRARQERDRVRRLRDGEDEPSLTPADLKALKAADAVEAKAVKGQRGAPSIRATASRMRSSVGAAVAARGEARRADLRLAQTLELEAAREGEPVDQVLEVKRGVKQKRIRTRDGLVLLHERGAFHPRDDKGEMRRDMAARIEAQRLLSAGERYRDRFEVAQASLKSCLAVADGVKPSPTLFVQAIAARRRAALANQVRLLEIAVVTQAGEDALYALRMVAGEARTVNSITTSGHRRSLLTAALVRALAVVAGILDRTG